MEKKREYEKLSEKMQVQGCKFSPSISKRNLKLANGPTDFGERLSKQVMEGKRYQGKSTFEIEAEKAKQELTFKPKLNQSRQTSIVHDDHINKSNKK